MALDKIQKESYAESREIPSYLLTHPAGPERMERIASMLQGSTPHTGDGESVEFGKRFPYFKAIVRARSLDPEDALKRFGRELKANPLSPAANFGEGIAYTEASEYASAIRCLETARKADPDSVPVLNALAEAYQLSGDEGKARQLLRRALEKDPNDGQALYLSGLSHENSGACGEAIQYYQRIIALGSPRPDVHYHLGRCYGRENRLGYAHYHFGIYFIANGEKAKARFHFKKAEELAADDPVLMRKIQEAVDRPR
jgi:predicted Zn-dependent protease